MAKTQIGVAVSLMSSGTEARANLESKVLLIAAERTGKGRVLAVLPAGKICRSLSFSTWWNTGKGEP